MLIGPFTANSVAGWMQVKVIRCEWGVDGALVVSPAMLGKFGQEMLYGNEVAFINCHFENTTSLINMSGSWNVPQTLH